MTDTTTVLEAIRLDLAAELQDDHPPALDQTTLPHSRYVLVSALQKSIRRGLETVALNCAVNLLQHEPDKFWRRLAVIAFEDVGIGDIDTVAFVVSATGAKRWRDAHGGDLPIASYLVRRLCRAIKDRSTDDLYVTAELHPDLHSLRLDLTFKPQGVLHNTIAKSRSLKHKALAAWYAAGTSRFRSDELRERRGDLQALFNFYGELGLSPFTVEVCRAGVSKSGVVLPVFFPLLMLAHRSSKQGETADILSVSPIVDGIPLCALDMFTREGHRAIAELIKQSSPLQTLLSDLAPKRSWQKVTRLLLFRAESSLVNRRLSWKSGTELRAHADYLDPHISPEAAPEALEAIRTHIPMLNEIRASVLRKKED